MDLQFASIQGYLNALEAGTFVMDRSILIKEVEPVQAALDICGPEMITKIEKAKVDRENYLDDYNFLKYLESLWVRQQLTQPLFKEQICLVD